MNREKRYAVVLYPKDGPIKRIMETDDEGAAIVFAQEMMKDKTVENVTVSEFELHFAGFVFDSRVKYM